MPTKARKSQLSNKLRGKPPTPAIAKMGQRQRSNQRYHSWRWTKASRAHRAKHPLCEQCKKEGRIQEGEVTDHIIPFPLCDFWDESNWQTLCSKCNIAKGNKDKRLIQQHRNEVK